MGRFIEPAECKDQAYSGWPLGGNPSELDQLDLDAGRRLIQEKLRPCPVDRIWHNETEARDLSPTSRAWCGIERGFAPGYGICAPDLTAPARKPGPRAGSIALRLSFPWVTSHTTPCLDSPRDAAAPPTIGAGDPDGAPRGGISAHPKGVSQRLNSHDPLTTSRERTSGEVTA